MPRQMISAENLEEAERALSRTYVIVHGEAAHERVQRRAGVDPEAFGKFAAHHKELLFKKYIPDADPRLESPIMTMMMHFFAVGAMSQRFADGRPS